MELLVFIIIVIALMAYLSRYTNIQSKSRSSQLRVILSELNERLALEFTIRRRATDTVLTGELGGVAITVELMQYGDQSFVGVHSLVMSFRCGENLSRSGVSEIRAEQFPHTIGKTVDEYHDIVTGDREFDRKVYVQGRDEAAARALMSKDLRADLARLCPLGLTFSISMSGVLGHINQSAVTGRDLVTTIATVTKTIAQTLADHEGVPGRLMENALHDPVPEVRLRCLRDLATHFPLDERAKATIATLLNDESAAVQIEAARAMDDDGLPHLLCILQSGKPLPDDTVFELVQHFRSFKFRDSIPVLCSLLAECYAADPESDRELIERSLMERLSKEHDHRVRVRIVHSPGQHIAGDERVIDTLNRTLSDPDIEVQLATAKYVGPPAGPHVQTLLERHHQTMTDDQVIQTLGLLRLFSDGDCVPALTTVYRQSFDRRRMLIELIRIFGELGDGALTPFLTDELRKNEGEILTTLITALGSVGTVEAVEPLYLAGKRSLNPVVRGTVRDAIERIQARLGTVESGWLSLVRLGEYEGGLSMATDAGDGALSVAEDSSEREKRR